jgi:hypothetical protein
MAVVESDWDSASCIDFLLIKYLCEASLVESKASLVYRSDIARNARPDRNFVSGSNVTFLADSCI